MSETANATEPLTRPSIWSKLPPWTGTLAALLLLSAVTVSIEWARDGRSAFLRPTNLMNILDNYSAVAIVAVGMTIVIIAGGIDLAVGSLLALAGGLAVLMLNAAGRGGLPDPLAVGLALLTAVAVGSIAGATNGLLIAKGRVAPFIATLGALLAYRSIALWIANGGQYFAIPSPLFEALGQRLPIPGTNIAPPGAPPRPFGIPYAVIVLLVVAVLGHVLLNRTRLGRYVYAIGCNERAAIYSAIPVDAVKMLTYTLIGLLTGIAGLLHAARYQSVNSANAGLLMELEVIAAVVVGGTRMTGGSGSIVGTILGVMLISVIRNMMVMINVTSYAQGLVMGLIIITAVLLQRVGSR